MGGSQQAFEVTAQLQSVLRVAGGSQVANPKQFPKASGWGASGAPF